jgi:hypothetical protein
MKRRGVVDKEERLHMAGRCILIFTEMLEAGGLQVGAVCGDCGLAVDASQLVAAPTVQAQPKHSVWIGNSSDTWW